MTTRQTSGVNGRGARERILLTAHDLFYRQGIRATGVDQLIAASGVAKLSFYRHFPGKNDLVRAFLTYRHESWMAWFRDALQRHGGQARSLAPAMAEWLGDPAFRGCAFINSVGELGDELPDVRAMAMRHKADMEAAIAALLPPSRRRKRLAQALAVAVDGAIIRAQIDGAPDAALAALETTRRSLCPPLPSPSSHS
jgi:AcrR family transcriptional regulator